MKSLMIIESERQTLKQRIGDRTVELTNYLKHNGGSGTKITGKALFLNKIRNLRS